MTIHLDDHSRATLLECLATLLAEVSDEERQLARALRALKPTVVTRAPLAVLAALDTERCACHENVIKAYRPLGGYTVAGWWMVSSGVWQLHSVLRVGKNYVCVTPHDTERFAFAPDPALTVTGEPYARGGVTMPGNVRVRPDRVRLDAERLRAEALAGDSVAGIPPSLDGFLMFLRAGAILADHRCQHMGLIPGKPDAYKVT